MTESCEIEKLKKNIDDAKIKLATEMKVCNEYSEKVHKYKKVCLEILLFLFQLRKQAASELEALKAELAQKKSQCSYNGPLSNSADLTTSHF